MNALKNILFFGLLLAVLYGVYLSLNRAPESSPLPPGLKGDTTPPNVDIGQLVSPPANIPGPPPDNLGFPAQPPINTQQNDLLGAAPPFRRPVADPPNVQIPPPHGDAANGRGMTDAARSLGLPDGHPMCCLPPPPDDHAAAQRQNYRADGGDAIDNRNVSAPPPADHLLTARIDGIMQQVNLQVEEKQFDLALLNLSQLYGNPDLPPSQAREITQLLDYMAAKVIYSREHLMEKSPYLVRGGDTLESIADRYQVPPLLLAKINGIHDWQNLPPGKELKVLKGPFSAQISTDRSEMTLMLDGRYAGRFNLALSSDLAHANGFCTVREKSPPTADADSRFKKQWIELGNFPGDPRAANGKISMQGTNDTRITAGRDSRNTIWLSEQDMDDVSSILSVGSRVIIQR